ncbi:MAG: hypothetical protein OEV45_01935 [Desulfobacteraceae bacterium]|nr:hypothetical protein [Desulfobacteraceae bacterium]
MQNPSNRVRYPPNLFANLHRSAGRNTEPLSFKILEELASEIIRDVPGIVSVTYNIAPKPPSTIEAV